MNDTFMKTKPVFPLLVSMALPNVISMLVNSLYNIVDSLFVARISEQAMTALSLVFPVQNLINAISIGFGIGINAQIALYLGAGDREKADISATHGMALSVLHGLLCTLIGIAIMPGFLRRFTADESLVSMGVLYTTIVFLFSIINMANLAFEKMFQAVGRRSAQGPARYYRRSPQSGQPWWSSSGHPESGPALPARHLPERSAGSLLPELRHGAGHLL